MPLCFKAPDQSYLQFIPVKIEQFEPEDSLMVSPNAKRLEFIMMPIVLVPNCITFLLLVLFGDFRKEFGGDFTSRKLLSLMLNFISLIQFINHHWFPDTYYKSVVNIYLMPTSCSSI